MSAGSSVKLDDGGYVTDVPYARTFNDHLSPRMLRLVAALNGCASPSDEEFDYLELGSGTGDSIVTLAAAFPRGRFVGVDFNPEHVAFAEALARRGGVTNVRFLQRDFEALSAEALPDFDFVVLHGVLSWISPSKRRSLLALAESKLRAGGLLYASYNALPGWAAIAPLRRLMLDHTEAIAGGSLARAREGLSFAKRLCEAGGVYFTSHPTAQSILELMLKAGLPYVVHEYFNQHWHPHYFADVAREMAEHGLSYVGQIPLYLGVRELALPTAIKALAKDLDDRIAFESLKDFAINEFFRNDVYVKGAFAPSESTTRNYLENTPFGTLAAASKIKRELRLPHYTLRFEGPLYDALIPVLAQRAASAVELAALPSLASFGARRIGDALQTMALGGQVAPMHRARELATALSVTEATAYRISLPFNRTILSQELSNRHAVVLASEVAGTGITLSMLDAVCLRALVEAAPSDRPQWIAAFVDRTPLRVASGDRVVEGNGKSDLVRLIADALERFIVDWPAKLCELGILERA